MSKSRTFGVELVSKGDEEVLHKHFEAKQKKRLQKHLTICHGNNYDKNVFEIITAKLVECAVVNLKMKLNQLRVNGL
jgi:hypothetical protein